jgi:hypothetical protein
MGDGAWFGLIVIALTVGTIIFDVIRRRRSASADIDVDVDGMPLRSALVSGTFMSWAGLIVVGRFTLLGLAMFALAGIAFAFAARMLVARRMAKTPRGELSSPAENYLIWVALGVPMLLVLGLLILAITGGLGSR